MSVETQTRDLLRRAGEEIDAPPSPIDHLLGSVARRRRKIATVVAACAAAAVVVVVALVQSPSGSDPEPTAPSPSPLPNPLPNAYGTMLVGMNGVAVAVPNTWTHDPVVCGREMSGVVSFESGPRQTCKQTPPPDASILRVADPRDNPEAYSFTTRNFADLTTVGDVSALRIPTLSHCPRLASCPEQRFEGALSIPDLHSAFWVSSPSRAVVDDILDSAQPIPDGYVAIPANATRADLEHLGLEVTPDDVAADRVLPTEPAEGSIVAIGSTVDMIPPPNEVAGCCLASVVVEMGTPKVEYSNDCSGIRVSVTVPPEPFENKVVLQLVDDAKLVGASEPTRLSASEPTTLIVRPPLAALGSMVDVYVRLSPPDENSYMDRALDVSLRLKGHPVCF